jgi:cyclophilin family peptidyl-prolyl cis-trans isomerase
MDKKTFVFILVLALIIVGVGYAITGNMANGTGNVVKDSKIPQVLIKTSMGDITVELYADKAPITVKNFLVYVDEKAYDKTVFHRVIDGFMVQGGGFTADGNEKPTHDPIKLESNNGLKNEKYTLAMARTTVPDSATNQFFINVNNNEFLNYGARDAGYAVFGKVIKGMDVVDKIAKVSTTTKNRMSDWPVKEVVIEKVERV